MKPLVSYRHHQAGFTLIELLVAMAISAILAILSYQAVNEVTQVKSRLEANNERFSALQRALWWMEQDFSQMTPRPVLDSLGSVLPSYQMQGQQVSLTRIATYPSPYGESGLVRVGYRLEGEVLYRRVWPVLDRAPDTQVQQWELLDGVKSFRIRQMDEKRQWQSYWPPLRQETDGQPPPKLPGLVEIVLEYEGVGQVRRLIRGADS
ncbi:type II secretion system protein GspJ [Hydrogenovibrio sp. SC-1]|uniref:type II secretion system minor pseudopilin GspJ n=1 Tax=Hydrogenovibrio sp. SC-1 TaxID=2065820 RepID=UPI000C7B749B|nr:type II secretion system minor pseudopilin GspJ [Hydrogenovibrio sp. SC-1]PLA75570.1 type II secretion system protein GspJ [Hydrogenovibrio sp. SC-1]